MGAPRPPQIVLGRTDELAAVSSLLQGVGGDQIAIVFVGVIGIGKTALVRAAAAEARALGFRVLATTPAVQDAGMSFSALEDLFHDIVDVAVPSLPDPQRRAIEVALLLRDSEGEPPSPLGVALAVRGVLSTLAEESPVLLAIDDAQWLDPPSAKALLHALLRMPGQRVAVVAAATIEGAHGAPEFLEGLVGESTLRFDLGPLSRDAIRELIRTDRGLALTGAELSMLHGACGGNPMFSLEVARMLPAGGGPRAGEPLPIPEDLRNLVHRQLSGLPAEAVDSLRVLAMSTDPAIRSGVAAEVVAAATEAGILEQSGGALRFIHPIYASVLYAEIDDGTRRALHRRLAAITEASEERALHLAMAADGPDSEASEALENAAVSARRRGAPSSGADLAEMARRMTPTDRSEDSTRRSLLAAELHLDAGEFDRAVVPLEEVLETVPAGSVRAAALQRLGWVRYHQDSWTGAADLYRDAAEQAGDDQALLAAIDLDTSVARLLSGDTQSAAAAARAALARAEVLGDQPTIGAAKAMTSSIEFLLGSTLAEDVMAGALDAETWSRPRPTMEHPSVAFGVMLKWSDELGRARDLLQGARARAEAEGTERSLPFILFHLAELECWAGDWEAASEAANAAVDSATRTGQDGGKSFAMAAAALVAVLRGRIDDARAFATEGLRLASRTGAVPAAVMLESVLGSLELSLGNAAAAHRHLGPLVARAAEDGIYEPGAVRHMGDAIEALVGVGDLETATLLTEQLQARSEELGRVWGLVVAARGRGFLMAAQGEIGGSQAAFEEALAASGRLGQPFELARTLLALGRARRRDRQKRSAREALEQALDGFQTLGAEQWAARTRDELGRIGGRASTTTTLTPAEERIARMVADGATNQEVAAALFLAVKTVEWNLARIFRKLGIRNRAELARWMSARPSA